jgi:uncharacterized protein
MMHNPSNGTQGLLSCPPAANSPFHSGEIEAQVRAGVGAPPIAAIRNFMPDQHREFFSMLPYVLMGAADDRGWPMATILTGPPGFITSPDPHTLSISTTPSIKDPLFDYLRSGAQVGLLGLDLGTRRRNRANGRILAADGTQMTIVVEQSFGNCAKYIQARDVEGMTDHLPGPTELLTGLHSCDRELIANADTFFVATSSGSQLETNGGVDISHRGGRPGFVRVDGETLTIPDFKGNRFFNTFGNMLVEPRSALLFVDFLRGDVLHLQGSAEIVWQPEGEDHGFAGAERLWRFHVVGGLHRPRAIPLTWNFREFAPTTEPTGSWSRTTASMP